MTEKFTPSPTAQINLVDKQGHVEKIIYMNRKQRRRNKIGVKSRNSPDSPGGKGGK